MKSRRDFLKLMTAGTCGALAHRILNPGFAAYADPLGALNSNRVFLLINFEGGVSYNIAPPYVGLYRDRNPTISYGPTDSLVLDSNQGLHPSLTALHQIWNEGRLAVLNLIGAGPNQSRSHDEATRQWHSGTSKIIGVSEGWGARLTSQLESTYGGISLSGSNTLGRGGTNPVRALGSLSSIGERRVFFDNNAAEFLKITRTNTVSASSHPSNPGFDYAKASIEKFQQSAEFLRPYAEITLPVTFPNTFLGNRLKDAARLIVAGPAIGLRFIYVGFGGFDTHAGERTALTSRLNEFNGAIGPFIQCMKQLNRWNDIVIAGMSEFCRTMENSSQGTDHGRAGPLFVLGGLVKGGVKTPAPTASDIGNRPYILTSHGTFAQVYGEIVSEFLGLDAQKVFNGDIVSSPYFDVI
jgi:uncharacterized protein (DUF1501 family)